MLTSRMVEAKTVHEAGLAGLETLLTRSSLPGPVDAIVETLLRHDAAEVDAYFAAPMLEVRLWAVFSAQSDAAFDGDAAANFGLQRALARVYDLQLKIPACDAPKPHGSRVIAQMRVRLEDFLYRWVKARCASRQEFYSSPSDSKDFLRWIKTRLSGHGAFKHSYYEEFLRERANVAAFRYFFIQELTVDGRFDDLVALLQVGTSGDAKLEIASNFWDEMGNGRAAEVHTDLFDRVLHHFGITAAEISQHTSLESLLCGNLSVLFSTARQHYYRGMGYYAATEYLVPGRFKRVLQGWERVGQAPETLEYHRVHIGIDSAHASGWFRNVIAPAVNESPECRHQVAEGILFRLETSLMYLEMLARTSAGALLD